MNGRVFVQIASLVSGAESGLQGRGVFVSKGFVFGFNGARSGYNSYYIDGAQRT